MSPNYSKLYNHERKVRWLEEEYPNEGTRKNHTSILVKVAKFEEDLRKDVCDFTYNECIELLMGLRKKTYKSINVAYSILLLYGDWADREGYNQIGFNNFKLVTQEDRRKCVNQIALKNTHFSREELYEFTSNLYNPIDAASLVLLFENVRGRSEEDNSFEEMRNLKFTDVFPMRNTLNLRRNDGFSRTITIDERSMRILESAMNQTDYHKNNGNSTGRLAIRPLKDSEYVLRTIDQNNSSDEKITIGSVSQKIKAIKYYLGIKFLTPTTIFDSGLIEKCELKEEELGKLEMQNYKDIYEDLKLPNSGHDLKEIYETYKIHKNNKGILV